MLNLKHSTLDVCLYFPSFTNTIALQHMHQQCAYRNTWRDIMLF